MPIYDYRCNECGRTSEILVRNYDTKIIRCPNCGNDKLERLVSASYLVRTEAKAPGARRAVEEPNGVRHHLIPQVTSDTGDRKMDKIELKPGYSTVEIPGKCLKCLAEQEYGDCLRQLLKGEEGKRELEERFEALVSLLKSPELAKLRDESEKYLADGKEVKLTIRLEEGKPKYEIKAD